MFAKNAWIGFTKCKLLLMRIEEERMEAIKSHKNILAEKIESIDYTHLLGYPSEVVAAEVITLVKEVVSDHMDKIVEQLEQLPIGTVLCDKCAYREECDDIQEKYDPDDNTDLCTMVAKSLAIEIVKGGTV